MIDLHTHSIHSDGTETPLELVKRAQSARLTAFAVADHDSVAGQEEALQAGKELVVKVISAIEMTVDFQRGHIHILGYGFDYKNQALCAALEKRAEERRQQFYEKVNMANVRLKEYGKDALDAEELLGSITGSPGRPHIARAIVVKGWEKDFRTAFDRYLLDYVPTIPAFSVAQAIALIKNAGGVTSLAHPGSDEIGLRRFCKNEDDERAALDELIDQGLEGLEAYTPAHKGDLVQYYIRVAHEMNLFITGGTDWHGPTFDAPAPGEFEILDDVYTCIAYLLDNVQ